MHKRFISALRKRRKKLQELGHETYEAYLNSPHWIARRSVYALTHPPTCRHCQELGALHHVSYERLGNETDDDLMWLCRGHHDEMHQWGEVVPATPSQRERLKAYGFTQEVVERLTRGVAYCLIDDIFNGRRLSPNSLPTSSSSAAL